MSIITYSDARKKFKEILDKVHEDKEAIVISRKNNENAVLLSEEEYNNLMETIYLVRNPANSKRLLESIQQLENNQAQERTLLDER